MLKAIARTGLWTIGVTLLLIISVFLSYAVFHDVDFAVLGVSEFIASVAPISLPVVRNLSLGAQETLQKRYLSEINPTEPLVVPSIDWLEWERSHGTEVMPQIDLSLPFVIKNGITHSKASKEWSMDWISEPPMGDIVVDYFSDARVAAKDGGSVPDAKAPVRDVIKLMKEGFPVKTGTEMVFRRFPDLLNDLPLDRLHAIFGQGHFQPYRVGNMLTVPIFVSRGVKEASNTTRTDLHCEPIANIAIQLEGSKTWTLVNPSQSTRMRPSLSPDGRAYIFANMDPHDEHITAIERYEYVAQPGDLLYLPTWWWHRVDYDQKPSFTASLFHVRVDQMLTTHPLFAAMLFPNLAKELVGWKTQ